MRCPHPGSGEARLGGRGGTEGTGARIAFGTPSARQAHLKDAYIHPKGKGRRPREGARRQACRVAPTAWEGILDTQGI